MKWNNVNYLTLPQQVEKNRKDILNIIGGGQGGGENVIDSIVVSVKKYGGDFSSLRKCFKTIKPTAKKPYIVELFEGTWNMNEEYANVWENPSFYGPTVPDYVTLKGIGDREKIIITASNGTDYMSTLNLANTASLENITVTADNMRYVIHDDFADNVQPDNFYYRNIINCVVRGENLRFASAYGAGVKQGAVYNFKNSKFINEGAGIWALSIHDNVDFDIESYIEIEGCEFISNNGNGYLVFGSMNAGVNGILTRVVIKGSKVNNLALTEEAPEIYGEGISFTVNGYGNQINSVQILNSDGLDYSSYVQLLGLSVADIVDNLTTENPWKPLSAYQGKLLNDAKANKEQEAWFTPTLINGWESTAGHPFQIRKTEFGQVVFRGSIKNGTTNEVAFELPAGYHVPNIITHPILIDNVVAGNTLYASAQYVVINGSGSVVVLDGISFYVD